MRRHFFRGVGTFSFSLFLSTQFQPQKRPPLSSTSGVPVDILVKQRLGISPLDMADDSEFVELNVGGQRFVSTRTTLLMKGSVQPSSFFTALLGGMFAFLLCHSRTFSALLPHCRRLAAILARLNCSHFAGKFSSPKDKEGALLIDRSPEKFRVILEYLRTGVLDIPKGITMCVLFRPHILLPFRKLTTTSSDQLIIEGDYYCLDTLVAALKERQEEELSPKFPSTPSPIPSVVRLDGCYSGQRQDGLKLAIAFIDKERFVMSKYFYYQDEKGRWPQSFSSPEDSLLTFLHSFPISPLWSQAGVSAVSQGTIDEALASVATETVIRGKYLIDENGKLSLTIGAGSTLLAFVSHNDSLIILDLRLRTYYCSINLQFKKW